MTDSSRTEGNLWGQGEKKYMKKIIVFLAWAVMAAGLTFGTGMRAMAAQAAGNEAATETTAATETAAVPETADAGESAGAEEQKVDIDLTPLSITMMFAETNNILSNPEPNLGKIIRLAGMYYSREDPETGKLQYYCSVYDGCCSTADVRFTPAEGAEDPESYLKKGDVILLTGEFASFEDNSLNPHGLINATLS